MSTTLHFDRFTLRPAERRLLAEGQPVDLGARALDLLIALTRDAGQLLTKDELLDRVWPDVIVEEANLHVQVSTLRKVLGRTAIATVPGRGYQFTLPVRFEAATPPATTPPPHAPLPALPALLGRDDALRQLQALVRTHALVTITGAGGSGKTLLARHLLLALQGWPPQGTTWVELLDVTDPDAVPGAVAEAIGLEAGAGSAGTLARSLRGSQRLLVLDNAEHVLPAVVDLVQALRSIAPEVRLLVTSQAPLKLSEERRLALPGLAVPAGPVGAEAARGFAAVSLFAERARQVDRRFRLDDTSVGDVIAICAALDGSALGVQLAASLLAMQPLAEVRRRIAPVSADHTGGSVDPSANVLRAALAWSHGLLDEPARRVFRRLAVAVGALPLPLLADVASDATLDATAVADALADLVDRSLVSLEPAGADAEAPPRYRLLDAPRALALEQLQASGEAPALQGRLAQALAARLRGNPTPTQALHMAKALRGSAALVAAADARAALDWALDHDLTDAALIAQSGACHQMPAAERVARASRLADAAQQHGVADEVAGEALLAAASLTKHSDLGRRQALMEMAADRYTAAGLMTDAYRALCRAAEAAAMRRRPAEAEPLLARATALHDPSWSPGLRELLATTEAALASARDDLHGAVDAWRRALQLGRQAGRVLLSTLISLADAELTVGLADDAVLHLREAAEVAQRCGNVVERSAFILANLAAACLARGDLAGARAAAAEAWPQARLLDADAWWADHLALLAAREGRPRTAALLLGLADAAYERIKDGRHQLETRHANQAATLAREVLGDAGFDALRRAGATPERGEALLQAALAHDDDAVAA